MSGNFNYISSLQSNRISLWPLAIGHCPSKAAEKNCLCSTRVALSVIRKSNLQFSLSWYYFFPHPLPFFPEQFHLIFILFLLAISYRPFGSRDFGDNCPKSLSNPCDSE